MRTTTHIGRRSFLTAGLVPQAHRRGIAGQTAGYRTQADGIQCCADCAHFIAEGICAMVAGPISGKGCCKLHTPLG